MELATTLLLWFGVIGCGLMAGVYFTFSAFAMQAFGTLSPPHGIAAMNAINDVILRSAFMPLFWGTTLASGALALLALFDWGNSAASAAFFGGLIYVIGMFICTLAFNVPLNNALVRGANGSEAVTTWQRYLIDWTRWNHVRTVSCTIAAALFMYALIDQA